MDKSHIPQFNGAAYTTWALKIQFGLVEKRLISAICDFKGRARVICPARILPLAQGDLSLLTLEDRVISRTENAADITTVRYSATYLYIIKDNSLVGQSCHLRLPNNWRVLLC